MRLRLSNSWLKIIVDKCILLDEFLVGLNARGVFPSYWSSGSVPFSLNLIVVFTVFIKTADSNMCADGE